MDKKDKPLYSIGEMERISGLNAQTIRRYDAKGILLGQRDETNGYRYYDSIELCMAMCIRYWRNCGFTLAEVDEFMKEKVETQIEMTGELRARLEREQLLLDGKLAVLSELHRALKRFYTAPKECGLAVRPAMVGIFYRDHNELVREEEDMGQMAEWVGATPLVQPMFCLSQDMIFAEGHPQTTYKIGLWVQEKYAKICRLPLDDSCVHIPEGQCIYTIFEGYDAVGDYACYLDEIRDRVTEYAQERNLRVGGPIYGSSFYSSRTKKGLHHLAHLWIPVQE